MPRLAVPLLLLCLFPDPIYPVQAPQLDLQALEELVNVEFRTDVRLFTVLAALNAAGFDYETPNQEMSSVRLGVRARLQDLDPEVKSALKQFYEAHRGGRDEHQIQSAYVSLALLLSGPPDFKLEAEEEALPGDAHTVQGFEALLPRFYAAAGIEQLWQQYLPEYQRILQGYRPLLADVIRETLAYFRTPARIQLDRRLVVSVDLLNIQGIVNARNMERMYYVVLGPTSDLSLHAPQLRHEYLHFLLDPLIEKFGAGLLKHEKLLSLAEQQSEFRTEYRGKFLLVVTESLIESLQLRINPPEDVEGKQVDLFRRGLIFVPYFYQQLSRFEESDLVSFPAYGETLFQEISEKQVRKFAESLQGEETPQEVAGEPPGQPSLQAPSAAALLAEAGELISRQDYTGAREKLAELLQHHPGHGPAHFYLAQVAAQEGEFEEAYEHYQRAAAAADTQEWVRAWALTRSANFLASRQRFEEARQVLEEVLAMRGDLRGARQQAEESLRRINEITGP